MKISLLFPVKEAALGGGNQFLKVLKKNLTELGLYSDLEAADIIIFNSYQYIPEVIKAKRKYPDKIFIHRIDGPIRLYNRMDDKRDYITNLANQYIADGTVYQSEYSRQENYNLGLRCNCYETIIYNCSDGRIFNKEGKLDFCKDRKIKLIAASWSDNLKKGFPVYQYLDETMDWTRYEMTFVGNSPVKFKNIKHISPLKSKELSQELKQHDIYISASQKDPCSNSVIEALCCGLPVLCFNDGGHPELVKGGGLLFDKKEDIPILLDKIIENYNDFKDEIVVFSEDEIVKQYVDFCRKIYNDVLGKTYGVKKIGLFREVVMLGKIKIWGKFKK